MTVIPVHDFVLFRVQKQKAHGGLHLPDHVEHRSRDYAVTVAVGPGRLRPDGTRAPMCVNVSDCFLPRSNYPITPMHHSDEELFMICEEGIMGLVYPDPDPENVQ